MMNTVENFQLCNDRIEYLTSVTASLTELYDSNVIADKDTKEELNVLISSLHDDIDELKALRCKIGHRVF